MKYQIDKSSGVSAYMQLYDQLRRDIARGSVKYGERLPSKRLLAGELGVSLITVEHAYALLVDEGYAEAQRVLCRFRREGGDFGPARAAGAGCLAPARTGGLPVLGAREGDAPGADGV